MHSYAAAAKDPFLFYVNAKLGEVKGIDMEPSADNLEVMQPITGLDRPVAIDFQSKTQTIFYSDSEKKIIGAYRLGKSNHKPNFITGRLYRFQQCIF